MNPICCNCQIEMRCLKNALKVAPVSNPGYQRSADKYGCEDCGAEVITGFSKPFTSLGSPDILLPERVVS